MFLVLEVTAQKNTDSNGQLFGVLSNPYDEELDNVDGNRGPKVNGVN